MEDIVKIVKSLENSGLLLDGVTKTVKNEVKEQKRGFLSMLLGKLGRSLLGNRLIGKGAIVKSQRRGIYRAGKTKGIKLVKGLQELVMETKWIFSVTLSFNN